MYITYMGYYITSPPTLIPVEPTAFFVEREVRKRKRIKEKCPNGER